MTRFHFCPDHTCQIFSFDFEIHLNISHTITPGPVWPGLNITPEVTHASADAAVSVSASLDPPPSSIFHFFHHLLLDTLNDIALDKDPYFKLPEIDCPVSGDIHFGKNPPDLRFIHLVIAHAL